MTFPITAVPNRGMKVSRYFTTQEDPYSKINWVRRDALIREKNKVVFEQKDVEVPDTWSQNAVNIVANKYFRGNLNTPEREYSVKQLLDRVVNTIVKWGKDGGYFATNEDADIFGQELKHLLVNQMMAFNSPVWFNVGVEKKPQCSACFINSIEDSMESIMGLVKTEGMLFKWGSGTGTNLSNLRGSMEKLRGGGTASGPVSFMKGFDAFAGVIKSGGKTRRAAKMVILDIDHPDIEEFIWCKAKEEKKAHALIDAGYDGSFTGEAYGTISFQNANNSVRVTNDFMKAVEADAEIDLISRTTKKAMKRVSAKKLWDEIAKAAWECGDPGLQFDTTINDWHTSPNTARINASNPCQPAWATVLTPNGISLFGQISVGSTIWSGKRWTKVVNKVCTGVKPVYRYYTRAGIFIGTEEHRVISGGERIEAQYAESIDTAQGEATNLEWVGWTPQDVVDGLVFGDGQATVISDFISRTAYDKTGYRVRTTLTEDELPLTFKRQIPTRFFQGDQLARQSFLRGLYSANGSVVRDRITLKAASFTVIDQVQQMLSSLGIRSYYTVNKAHDVEFSNGSYTSKESYDLNITTDRNKFQRLIGFVQSYKTEKLNAIVKDTGPSPRSPKSSYDIISKQYVGDEVVWDITVEDEDHTYWTGGLLVSNCSEYMFLDDSACNLASLNLRKFQIETGDFDAVSFRKAVEISILAQEILVGNASYPTPMIEKNSHEFRPLGLGYANLGALLMSMGLPYDSDGGRGVAALITSIMCGQAYLTSAQIAEQVGACKGYHVNREPFLKVIAKHRSAHEKIGWQNSPLFNVGQEVWDEALVLGKTHGYRNAQVTVLAPTGTIGFLMDCDTTGIEPDIALVKYKKLVGGGDMKIVNQTVPISLAKLGYNLADTRTIINSILEYGTIEGCALLKQEHLPIFDCAFVAGNGKRSISWQGHVMMMAAVQPFLSGAISKTVNLPADATVDDIKSAYAMAWVTGLKAIAVYRDGCKRSQPLTTKKEETAVTKALQWGQKKKLGETRDARIHKFNIGGQKGYITVGLYEDGTPGEIFIEVAKAGSFLNGVLDSFAKALSTALKYGAPFDDLYEKFVDTRFDPSGITTNPAIQFCSSLPDYVVRWMKKEFYTKEETQLPELPAPPILSISAARVTQRVGYDGPPCSSCGSPTRRAGTCFVCDCGTTSGCG